MRLKTQSLPNATVREWLLSFIGLRLRFRITGDSMLPTLAKGDLVLANKAAYKVASPQVGDIVLAFHPKKKNFVIIKRITSVNADGKLFLKSDNPIGNDSRQFGEVDVDAIIAKVVAHSSRSSS